MVSPYKGHAPNQVVERPHKLDDIIRGDKGERMRRHHVLRSTICLGFLVGTLPGTPLRADSRSDAWLRFARLDAPAAQMYETLPARLVVLGQSAILDTAQKELTRGLKQMLEKTLRAQPDLPQENSFILAHSRRSRQPSPKFEPSAK